jgi:thiol-disulfide isomerase/thioredoxin
MKITPALTLALSSLLAAAALAQATSPNTPKPGTPAPPLNFTQLLQAPPESKIDWPSLRGKVVVLEFWATWCAPCIAEIPTLNSLVASVDPAKVRFISVDDEDPTVVQAFLKKKPISGWIGLDTSGKVFERYGVEARPATIVIDPAGRIASATAHPEQLHAQQLMALAAGKPAVLDTPASAKTQADMKAAVDQAMAEQSGAIARNAKALFEISLSPGDPPTAGKDPDTHMLMRGPGQFDITNAPVTMLLGQSSGIPESRITFTGTPPTTTYSLHVEAPGADPQQLSRAVELAVESGAHLHVERRTALEDAWVLSAKPDAQSHFNQDPHSGAAIYSLKSQTLYSLNATAEQLTGALETALGAPIVNETNLSGVLMTNLKMASKDLASAQTALAAIGLDLTQAKRPITRLILSAASPSADPH